MSHSVMISVETVPSDDSANKVMLGVTLTVLPGSAPFLSGNLPDPLTRPWMWVISGWSAWGRKDASANWAPITAQPALIAPPDGPSGDWKNVVLSIEDKLENAIKKITDWSAPQPTPGTRIDLKDGNSAAAGHKYLSLLANAASGPYPIPQNLQLSFSMSLKKSDISPSMAEFLVAPTFTANGVTAAPGSGLPKASDDLWDLGASSVQMLAQFNSPANDPQIDFSTLWLKPLKATEKLVSDWSAQLYEITAPYLNLPAMLVKYVTSTVMPDGSGDWPAFRMLMIKGLYDLLNVAIPPNSAAVPPTIEKWCLTLASAVGAQFSNLPVALNPDDKTSRSYLEEMGDLQGLVKAATTGATLLGLVPKESQANLQGSTAEELAAGLLLRLQVQLAVTNATLIGQACQGKSTDFDGISKNLSNNVVKPYLSFRATNLLGTPYPATSGGGQPPAWISQVPALIQPNLSGDLRLQATGIKGNELPTTTKAPPMVIPVLDLRASDPSAPDPLHGIRGLGVLMRRKGTDASEWCCLNVGSLVEGPNLPVLVASRPGYNRQLLTGYVLYDNGPLLCENLLHQYMKPSMRLNSPQGDTDIPPVFQYAPFEIKTPTDLAAQLYGTPMLEAGSSYEVSCFAVSNSGALPVGLRDPNHPAKLNVKIRDLLNAQPPTGTQLVSYQRTVAVGAAEFRRNDGRSVQSPASILPSILENVWPRAVEAIVPRKGVGSVNCAAPTPGAHGKQSIPNALGSLQYKERANPTMLFLAAPDQGCTPPCMPASGTQPLVQFSLKLPSVDPQTWDRTAGYSHKADKLSRAMVLDLAYQTLANNQTPEITDPLIQSTEVALYRWNETGCWELASANAKAQFPLSSLLKQNAGMPGVETNAIYVSMNAGMDDTVKQIKAGVRVGVVPETPPAVGQGPPATTSLLDTLQPGDIYLLEATLNLDSARVSRDMPNYASSVIGFQMLIESASAAMPSLVEKGALTSRLTAKTVSVDLVEDQKVLVTLDAAPQGKADPWRNIHQVDFLRQTWFWTGRTQPSGKSSTDANYLSPGYFPVGAGAGSTEWKEWAKVEFAERPWTDHVQLPTERKGGAAPSFQWEQDLSLDPRAAFLRFAPLIFSRYQGAYPALSSEGSTTVGVPTIDDLWLPCFVRSRVKTLTAPRLKALIPLTESAFALGTPGILAVFDGPVYDQAGLAERMVATIAKVHDPNLGPDSNVGEWDEAGPDFLVSRVTEVASTDLQTKIALLAIGPIGHTLDSTASSFPKFLSSSWIIRPDLSKFSKSVDFSWWFANLEFQLQLDSASSLFPGVQSTVVSGSWIQFLPGFQDEQGKALVFKDMGLERVDRNGIRIHTPVGGLFKPKPTDYHLAHYVLVTREVRDITGLSREAYVGVAAATAQADVTGGIWRLLSGDLPPTSSKLRVRFLDIRSGDISRSADFDDVAFWTRILGAAGAVTDINRASIVSVSPVITEGGCSQ